MVVRNAMEELRRQYFVCKGPRTVADVALEMGISRQVLTRFGRGGYMSLRVVEAIEEWVADQEMSQRQRSRLTARPS